MKRTKFTDGQITFALRQAETDTLVAEVRRLKRMVADLSLFIVSESGTDLVERIS